MIFLSQAAGDRHDLQAAEMALSRHALGSRAGNLARGRSSSRSKLRARRTSAVAAVDMPMPVAAGPMPPLLGKGAAGIVRP